jgi:DNA-binding transcriptional LysR family regulator
MTAKALIISSVRVRAALAGAGIAGLPLMISREEVASGRLIEVLPEAQLPSSELYAVYRRGAFKP